MVYRKNIDGITWVDIETPSTNELDEVSKEFGIDPFVREELISPTLHPFVITFPHYLYIILHFPVSEQSHSREGNQEIDCMVGKDFLITVRYDAVDSLHHFHKVLETEAILDREPAFRHAGELFVQMMGRLYGGVESELVHLESELATIEQQLFDEKEKEMLVNISKLSRTLLLFRQALKNHGEPLNSFIEEGSAFFGKSFTLTAQGLLGEGHRLTRRVEASIEMLRELRETNSGLLYSKQNEIMKNLTIMAFVVLPLSFVAGIFGMNTTHTPLIGADYDFWIVIAMMIGITILLFSFFRLKKWL